MANQPKRPTRREPNFDESIQIHKLLEQGFYQHEIASMFGYNQGRISDVKTGKKWPTSKQAAFG